MSEAATEERTFSQPGTPRALIDMDGVLVDMVAGVAELYNLDPRDFYEFWLHTVGVAGRFDLEHALTTVLDREVTAAEWWGRVDKVGHNYWANLNPYNWTAELLNRVTRRFTIRETYILSSPGRDPASASGKVESIRRMMGYSFRNYALCPPKHIAAAPKHVLIDDYDANLSSFKKHGGQTVLVPQPWNAGYHVLRLWQHEAEQKGINPLWYRRQQTLDYVDTQLQVIFDTWAAEEGRVA